MVGLGTYSREQEGEVRAAARDHGRRAADHRRLSRTFRRAIRRRWAGAGYTVDAPASADEVRERILTGTAARFGADANVHARIPTDDHVRRERWLAEIEAQWGPAPGRQQSDGSAI